MAKKLKIGIVVQRYAHDINGGAEYHARLIAELLNNDYEIEVFTSKAIDYITWEDHFKDEIEIINNVKVNRFSVRKPRNPKSFGEIQNFILNEEHSINDEYLWMEEQGPLLDELLLNLEKRYNEFDLFIFFSYRYYHSFYGIKKFKDKSILVPTAEHDDIIYLRLFKNFFHLPKAFVYNSLEEKEIINKISDNKSVPGDIVGVGSEIPDKFEPESFRKKYNIRNRYFLYIGRLDENKGIPMLFDYYLTLLNEKKIDMDLVLIGKEKIEIPKHKKIIHLGFLQNKEKFDALKGSEFLIIPSQYESLSMVSLEAWAIGKPVVANGKTEVLKGQCIRSNAGLWFENYEEFKEIILLLDKNKNLLINLGENGIEFFKKNYTWQVIKEKYNNIIKKSLKTS